MDPKGCPVCGNATFRANRVLWPALIAEWQLAPDEVDYVDRQQGELCTACGANLRSMALADALLALFGRTGTLIEFVREDGPGRPAVLEINPAGTLSPVLSQLPGHVLAVYPEIDIHALPYADESFDAVVHSDTLEHVPNPIHALAECRRVLKRGAALCFTIPVIVGRLSRGRDGLPPSYHGDSKEGRSDWLVQTEFGADMWTFPIRAGFTTVTLTARGYPAALAMTARRS